jgi:hypothetical protein
MWLAGRGLQKSRTAVPNKTLFAGNNSIEIEEKNKNVFLRTHITDNRKL